MFSECQLEHIVQAIKEFHRVCVTDDIWYVACLEPLPSVRVKRESSNVPLHHLLQQYKNMKLARAGGATWYDSKPTIGYWAMYTLLHFDDSSINVRCTTLYVP